ncbi:MAG: aminoacyl-tRNA hydrolase [Bacilli bacterium]
MKLIVGLGNPGREYENTRHNIGFVIVDEVAKEFGISRYDEKFKGYYAKVRVGQEQVIILKPLTFMNLSGESVRAVVDFYKINIDDILVVYDDLDLDVGRLRFRAKSSNGGHNGIKSIEQHLGTNEFKRLKFGISRSSQIPVIKYVLGKFSEEELKVVIPQIKMAKEACIDFVKYDFLTLRSKYN